METRFNGTSSYTLINRAIAERTPLSQFLKISGIYRRSTCFKVHRGPSCDIVMLKEADKVLINNIHDYSDWVVTFDKNLGPEIYNFHW